PLDVVFLQGRIENEAVLDAPELRLEISRELAAGSIGIAIEEVIRRRSDVELSADGVFGGQEQPGDSGNRGSYDRAEADGEHPAPAQGSHETAEIRPRSERGR